MKILFVQEYYYPYVGGIENLFKALAEKLTEKGHQVFVITSKYDKNLSSTEDINGVKIRRINTRSRVMFAFKAMLPVYKQAKYFDLIQTTPYTGIIPALVGGSMRRKKIVITYHEFWGQLWFKLPFLNFYARVVNFMLEYLIVRLPYDKIVAVSDYTRQSLIKNNVKKSKIVRIYNGIDYSSFGEFSWQKPNQFTFTYFGRLGISKGLDILLKAAGRFIKDYDHTYLKLIIPTIPKKMYKRINKMIKKLELTERIQILNNLSKRQLYQEICQSHCIVVPSYSEGFCFSAVESIGLGIPVISSGRGALKEVVSGLYIKLKELTVQNLYDALVKAKEGKWEKSPVKKFELETQIKSYENLYSALISTK